MKNKLFLPLLMVVAWVYSNSHAQSVTIDPSNSASAIIDAKSVLRGFLPPRMTEFQRNTNLGAVTVGTIVFCTDCVSGVGPYYHNGLSWVPMFPAAPPPNSYSIGQAVLGGVVFYVEPSGQHGLIAATSDVGTAAWFNVNYTNTQAVRNGVYGGAFNTDVINLNQGTGNTYAALLAAQHNGGGFGDWYLPSAGELQLLYNQRLVVGGFSNTFYWSSTEVSVAANTPVFNAYLVNFAVGSSLLQTSKAVAARVRPIRRF